MNANTAPIAPTFTGYDSVTTVPATDIVPGDFVFMSAASVMTCAPVGSPTRTARLVASVRTDDVPGLGTLTYIAYVTTGPRSESVFMDGGTVTIPVHTPKS